MTTAFPIRVGPAALNVCSRLRFPTCGVCVLGKSAQSIKISDSVWVILRLLFLTAPVYTYPMPPDRLPKDASPEAEQILLDLLRQAPVWRKFKMVGELNAALRLVTCSRSILVAGNGRFDRRGNHQNVLNDLRDDVRIKMIGKGHRSPIITLENRYSLTPERRMKNGPPTSTDLSN